MANVGKITPAGTWRAFFISLLCGSVNALFGAAPAGPLPELAQVGKPTPTEAAKLVEQFRNSGLPGEYYLEFELRHILRRGGDGQTFKGRMWGSRNDAGALTRVELSDAAGVAHRLILQNGEHAKVWRLVRGAPVELGIAELMSPLVPGIEISAFDLQMPFLYWPGATVDKVTRVLGRPTYLINFPAPEAFKTQFSDISAARANFDAKFNVPMQTEVIGRAGNPTKTLALLTLQTIEKQTLPKSADYRNELTRDKTRLQITGVALNLNLPETLFQAATLTQAGALPPPGRIVRVTP